MMKRTLAPAWPVAISALLLASYLSADALDAQRRRSGGGGKDEPAKESELRITTVTEDGGRLDWSARLNLIAFDRRGRDGYFDVYTMTPDGGGVKCITCDKPDLPNKSMGNPAWHPSGDYIAFQAQNTFRGLGKITDYFANPGAGLNNDVWVTDRDGRRFWQLTKVEPRRGGVLHASFSESGDKLFWSERVENRGSMGTWSLRVADFVIGQDGPRIENVRPLQPGRKNEFYESHGFSPDGKSILFSGNLEPDSKTDGMDVYLYNLATQELKNLTQSRDEWDEHAHFAPDGRSIVWMTNKDQRDFIRKGQPRTDYWLMDPDGTNKRRLTHFNESGHPEYIKGGVTAADNSWGPDGSRLAAYLIGDVAKGGKIVMIDLSSRGRGRERH